MYHVEFLEENIKASEHANRTSIFDNTLKIHLKVHAESAGKLT